jgi:outer membrane protein
MRLSSHFFSSITVVCAIVTAVDIRAQSGESNAAVPLQITHQLQIQPLAIAEKGVAAADNSLPQMLSVVENCAAVPNGVLRLDVVLNRVICNRSGVREGAGLAVQGKAVLEIAQLQNRPKVSLTTAVDAQRDYGVNASLAARMDWVLFDFGSKDAAVFQARQALAALLDDQRVEVLLAISDAAQLFATAKTNFGRFDVAATNLRVATDSARMAQARYEAGASTLSDKLQTQTALAQSRLEHTRARAQWYSASGALAVAMGLPASHAIDFEPVERDTDTLSYPALDVSLLMQEASERHPRIAAARSRLAQTQLRAKAIETEKWGAVNVSVVAGTGRSGNNRAVSDTSTAALLWTLPLFDRDLTDARQREVAGQIQTRGVAVSEAMTQVALQVWLNSQSLNADREVLRDSREVLEYSETFLRASSERYRAGIGGLADVLTAQNIAANARFQWVEAKANLLKSQLKLAAAVGRLGPLSSN